MLFEGHPQKRLDRTIEDTLLENSGSIQLSIAWISLKQNQAILQWGEKLTSTPNGQARSKSSSWSREKEIRKRWLSSALRRILVRKNRGSIPEIQEVTWISKLISSIPNLQAPQERNTVNTPEIQEVTWTIEEFLARNTANHPRYKRSHEHCYPRYKRSYEFHSE